MNNNTLAYDLRNVMHMAAYRFLDRKTTSGEFSGHIAGFCQILVGDYKVWSPTKAIWILEEKAERKLDILPSYKSSRDRSKRTFDSSKCYADLLELVALLPGETAEIPREEADDVAAALVERKGVSRGRPLIIVTSDKDIFQLVDLARGVSCYDRQRKLRLCSDADLMNRMDLRACDIALDKTLYGDKGDSVPCLFYKRHLNAKKYGGPLGWPRDPADPSSVDWVIERLKERKQLDVDNPDREEYILAFPTEKQVRLNWELVKLDGPALLPKLQTKKYPGDRRGLEAFLDRFEIKRSKQRMLDLIPNKPRLFGM